MLGFAHSLSTRERVEIPTHGEGIVFDAFRMSGRINAPRLIVAACALEILATTAIYGWERIALRLARDRAIVGTPPDHSWYEYAVPGVVRPTVVSAKASTLAAEEPVFGVVIDGKARAYRLAALTDRTSHVVNDILGGVPVSIAYCDLTDCVRGYTSPRGKTPLNVSIAGLYDGEMVISLDGARVMQATGRPFQRLRRRPESHLRTS